MNLNRKNYAPALHYASLGFAILPILLFGFALAGCDTSDNAKSDVAAQAPTATPVSSTDDRTYSYGTKIDFNVGGNAARYKVSGWSAPESEGTWTEGETATLSFAAPPSGGAIIFRATMSGFTKLPELPSQPVDVLVNGAPVTHWEVAAKGLVQMQIPANLVQGGKMVLEFKLPKAVSPASLGTSVDQRRLGLRFYDLELVKL